jgi:hypothetical protein
VAGYGWVTEAVGCQLGSQVGSPCHPTKPPGIVARIRSRPADDGSRDLAAMATARKIADGHRDPDKPALVLGDGLQRVRELIESCIIEWLGRRPGNGGARGRVDGEVARSVRGRRSPWGDARGPVDLDDEAAEDEGRARAERGKCLAGRGLRLKLVYPAVDERRSALGLDGSDPDLYVRGRPLLAKDERPGLLGEDDDLFWSPDILQNH